MTLIRNDTQAEVENMQAGDIDMQKITAWINNTKYTFYNVYWPNNSFSKLPLDEVAFKRTILAGDFNANPDEPSIKAIAASEAFAGNFNPPNLSSIRTIN